jgi:hypothetical protein
MAPRGVVQRDFGIGTTPRGPTSAIAATLSGEAQGVIDCIQRDRHTDTTTTTA